MRAIARDMLDDCNYYSDRRVSSVGKYYNKEYDANSMTITKTLYNDDEGEEFVVEFKARFEVCPICDGHGSHVNPSIDAGGICLGGYDHDCDDEFLNDYTNGTFDIACQTCDGRRVVPMIDTSDKVYQKYKDKLKAMEDDEREFEAECRAERMMGA